MPNWCYNRVQLSDNGETSEQFDRLCKILDGDNPFNTIYPRPDFSKIPNNKGELPKKEVRKNDKGEIVWETFNFSDGKNDDRWYHWCINNWGTKWDMCDKSTAEVDEGWAEFGFNTAWAPASGIFDKIKEDYPDVGISWFYDEPGCEIAGYLPN